MTQAHAALNHYGVIYMRVQYSIPDALEQQIRTIAEANGITASQLVVAAVKRWMVSGEALVLVPASPLPQSTAQATDSQPQSKRSTAAQLAVTQPQPDRGKHAPIRPGATLWEGSSEAEGDFVCCERCGTTLTPERHDGMKHLDCPVDGLGVAR